MKKALGTIYESNYDLDLLTDKLPIYVGGYHSPDAEPPNYMHYHNCLEIGFCVEGAGVFFVEDKVYSFSKNDICIISKNEFHIAQSDGKQLSKWIFAYLDLTKILVEVNNSFFFQYPYLTDYIGPVHIVHHDEAPEITTIVPELLTELENKQDGYLVIIKALLCSLITKYRRRYSMHNSEANAIERKDFIKIVPALKYISEHYMEEVKIKTLAQICSLSVPHFRKLFRETIQSAPSSYLYKVRIQMATTHLKNTNSSIIDIALKVGYQSLSSFNRHFKELMGMSPREWRKLC